MTDPSADTKKAPFWKNPYFIAAIAGMITLTVLRPYLRHVPDPPKKIGDIPAYTLTDHRGKPFGSANLAGKVYVVSFFFTTCPSICPRLTKAMIKLQKRYKKHGVTGIELVSITVDPETDTPEILRQYAKKYELDLSNWTLLTGSRKKIEALIFNGFKQHLGKKETVNNIVDIAHSSRFAIVDKTGGLRGLYRSDDEGIDEIFHRSRHVLKAK